MPAMASKNNAPSLLQGFSRFLKPADPVSTRAMPANPMPESEDELEFLPAKPHSDGVQVREVDQTEFLREWGRAVAQKVLARAGTDTDEDELIDRRLPNFDRRHPDSERRALNLEDRRHGAPWPVGERRNQRRSGDPDRRLHDRRAYALHDRRIPSLLVKR